MIEIVKKVIFFGSFIFSLALSLGHQTNLLGQATLALLTLILFIKPLARLFPSISLFKATLALRKELGIASGFTVFGHVFAQASTDFNVFDLLIFDLTSGWRSFQFWGFWGFAFLIPLFITSNNFSINLLKKNWLYLHKLVHPLYIAAILHVGLRPNSWGLYPSLALLFLLYFLRFLARRGVTFFAASRPPNL